MAKTPTPMPKPKRNRRSRRQALIDRVKRDPVGFVNDYLKMQGRYMALART